MADSRPSHIEDDIAVKKSATRNRRTLDRDLNGFNDPLVKIVLGIGIVVTAILCIAVLLTLLIGVQFLGLLIFAMWLLGAFAVFGAICGLVSGIRWRTGARARRASTGF